MRIALVALAVVLALAPVPLAGQAPVVTEAGDPSVDADTIYALAVDPAEHPDESAVLLLDDGIVVRQTDGTVIETYRYVAQVLTRDGVDGWAEHGWSYDANRERFRLNWARVVRSDGTVISDVPLIEQTSDLPAPSDSPVYTDAKRMRVSLGSVEPGTIVDVSYTRETITPAMPGDFYASWSITTGGTVRRSRFVVDVPADYPLRVRERNVARPAVATEVGGRKVLAWAAADLPRLQPESFVDFAASPVLQSVRVGGPVTWEGIGSWWVEQARERFVLDESVRAAARQALAGAATDRERLEELHRWIAQDFRYISLALGEGGYQPRFPAEVVATLSGDCKDTAVLFVLLARELGFEAYPVLLNSSSLDAENPPSIHAFDHMIAAVRLDGAWTYLDLTAPLIPFGEIHASYRGDPGLIVFDDGRIEEITFPEGGPDRDWARVTMTGELTEDGTFTGTVVSEGAGLGAYGMRDVFARDISDRDWAQLATAIAGTVVRGARGQNLEAFDGRDLAADVRVRLDVRAERVLQRMGGAFALVLPDAWNVTNHEAVPILQEEAGRRVHPIAVEGILPTVRNVNELILTLPQGWKAALPPSVVVDEVWGTYRATYAQEGRTLTVRRESIGKRGTQPREALPDLIRFLERINEDDVSMISLQPES